MGWLLDLIFEAPFVDLTLTDPLLKVVLITDKDDGSLICFHLAEIVPLFLDVLEGTLAGEVEDHQHSMTPLEVGRDYRAVLLLACSIPYV